MLRKGMGKLPVSLPLVQGASSYPVMALLLGLLVTGITRSVPGAELPARLRRPIGQETCLGI